MPKNKVQFQKGYSLSRFINQYGTEEKCRQRLFNIRWTNGFSSPKSQHQKYYELKTRKLFLCCKYRCQCPLTSETVFEASKLPLTTWFLAIYLITHSKQGISALSLRRFLGTSVNAVFRSNISCSMS